MNNPLGLVPPTIVDRFMSKDRLYRNGNISSDVRDMLTRQVEKITWAYKLAPSTINVPKGDYAEVEIFRLNLKTREIDDRVLRFIDSIIYQPIIYVVQSNDLQQLIGCYKSPDNVVGRYFKSYWQERWQIALKGNTIDEIYGNLLHIIDNKLVSDRLPVAEAVERYEQMIDAQKQLDKLNQQIRNEPNVAKKQELAKKRAELLAMSHNG